MFIIVADFKAISRMSDYSDFSAKRKKIRNFGFTPKLRIFSLKTILNCKNGKKKALIDVRSINAF